MKDFIAVAVILGAGFAFSGCTNTSFYDAKWGRDKPKTSFMVLDSSEARNGIYSWRPDTVAAVSRGVYAKDKQGQIITYEKSVSYVKSEPTNKFKKKEYGTRKISVPYYEQKLCVMSAAAIKAQDSEGGLVINVPVSAAGAKSEVDFRAVVREIQRVTELSRKKEAATFLDIALFNICLASMNGYIEDPEIIRSLVMEAIAKSATIAELEAETKQKELNPDLEQSSSGINVSGTTSGETAKPPEDLDLGKK